MSLRAAEATSWERWNPLSQLRKDISWLRNTVENLRNDTWVRDNRNLAVLCLQVSPEHNNMP